MTNGRWRLAGPGMGRDRMGQNRKGGENKVADRLRPRRWYGEATGDPNGKRGTGKVIGMWIETGA